jgi:AcrR family transcriptional regulator
LVSEHSLNYDRSVTPSPRLSGDDRRAQIVEAVTPAVLEHGAAITTRQLAEAAGVAEGTLFKAFGDKESLLTAVAEHHLATEDFAAELGALAFDSLEELVTVIGAALVTRMRFIFRLVVALGPVGQRVAAERHAEFEASKHRLAERFVPFRDELRVTPIVAADLLRTLAWAASASWGETEPTSSADDIVQVLLHGIVASDGTRASHGTRAAASAPETQKV